MTRPAGFLNAAFICVLALWAHVLSRSRRRSTLFCAFCHQTDGVVPGMFDASQRLVLCKPIRGNVWSVTPIANPVPR
jgi:hypothetical protein